MDRGRASNQTSRGRASSRGSWRFAPTETGVVAVPQYASCRIAFALFAPGIALSVLLIAAYTWPFTGELIVGPELLKLVAATHPASNQ